MPIVTKFSEMDIMVSSLGQNNHVSQEPMIIVDVNNVRSPLSNKDFINRYSTGEAEEIVNWVKLDRRMPALEAEALVLAQDFLKAQKRQYFTIGYQDYHGRWASVAVAVHIANLLSVDYKVGVMHNGLL